MRQSRAHMLQHNEEVTGKLASMRRLPQSVFRAGSPMQVRTLLRSCDDLPGCLILCVEVCNYLVMCAPELICDQRTCLQTAAQLRMDACRATLALHLCTCIGVLVIAALRAIQRWHTLASSIEQSRNVASNVLMSTGRTPRALPQL